MCWSSGLQTTPLRSPRPARQSVGAVPSALLAPASIGRPLIPSLRVLLWFLPHALSEVRVSASSALPWDVRGHRQKLPSAGESEQRLQGGSERRRGTIGGREVQSRSAAWPASGEAGEGPCWPPAASACRGPRWLGPLRNPHPCPRRVSGLRAGLPQSLGLAALLLWRCQLAASLPAVPGAISGSGHCVPASAVDWAWYLPQWGREPGAQFHRRLPWGPRVFFRGEPWSRQPGRGLPSGRVKAAPQRVPGALGRSCAPSGAPFCPGPPGCPASRVDRQQGVVLMGCCPEGGALGLSGGFCLGAPHPSCLPCLCSVLPALLTFGGGGRERKQLGARLKPTSKTDAPRARPPECLGWW